MKEGWGRRAVWLNTLPCLGKFEYLEEYNIHNGDIIESLTLEWRRFIVVLIITIVRNPRTPLYQLGVCFGKDGLEIRCQSYRTFNISFLLQLFTFGKCLRKL